MLAIKTTRQTPDLWLTDAYIRRYFPAYLLEIPTISVGTIRHAFFRFILWFLETGIKIFLRPRSAKTVGALNPDEVMAVYDEQARRYDKTHHLTTRGQDLQWRREAASYAAMVARGRQDDLSVLDLCTGTGLTIQAMHDAFSQYGLHAHVVGLDLNQKMLDFAHRENGSNGRFMVDYVRGDATNMVGTPSSGLVRFSEHSFDVVTQVFGIGGIPDSHLVFENVIRLLRPNGRFWMCDMHHPLAQFAGEMPFFLKWIATPAFEHIAYRTVTIPVALKQLWAWRDTTPDFYYLPLATYHDDRGIWWGFEVEQFYVESQRWWLSIPVMPTAKIAVRKVSLSIDEALRRRKMTEMLVSHFRQNPVVRE